MIKAGQPVFFGCDVGKFSDRETGIMDTALFEYEVSSKREALFSIPFFKKSMFRTRSISTSGSPKLIVSKLTIQL